MENIKTAAKVKDHLSKQLRESLDQRGITDKVCEDVAKMLNIGWGTGYRYLRDSSDTLPSGITKIDFQGDVITDIHYSYESIINQKVDVNSITINGSDLVEIGKNERVLEPEERVYNQQQLAYLWTTAKEFDKVSDFIDFLKRTEFPVDQPRWISVEESLPELGNVLVYDGTVFEAEYYEIPTSNKRVFVYIDEIGNPIDDVTHWMPLPEPPTQEGKP